MMTLIFPFNISGMASGQTSTNATIVTAAPGNVSTARFVFTKTAHPDMNLFSELIQKIIEIYTLFK